MNKENDFTKLSVFKIEDVSTDDYDCVRIECYPGTILEEATMSFTKQVFANGNTNMVYNVLKAKLGDETEWNAEDLQDDCVRILGVTARVRVPDHYRFEKKKGVRVKAKPERIIKYVKVVALNGFTIEEEIERYKSQIPDECKIESDNDEVEAE